MTYIIYMTYISGLRRRSKHPFLGYIDLSASAGFFQIPEVDFGCCVKELLMAVLDPPFLTNSLNKPQSTADSFSYSILTRFQPAV